MVPYSLKPSAAKTCSSTAFRVSLSSGFTKNPDIPIAKSIVDYIFRWMGSRFLSKDDRDALGIMGGEVVAEAPTEPSPQLGAFDPVDDSAESTPAEVPPAPSSSSDGVGGDRPLAFGEMEGAVAATNGKGDGHGQVVA